MFKEEKQNHQISLTKNQRQLLNWGCCVTRPQPDPRGRQTAYFLNDTAMHEKELKSLKSPSLCYFQDLIFGSNLNCSFGRTLNIKALAVEMQLNISTKWNTELRNVRPANIFMEIATQRQTPSLLCFREKDSQRQRTCPILHKVSLSRIQTGIQFSYKKKKKKPQQGLIEIELFAPNYFATKRQRQDSHLVS